MKSPGLPAAKTIEQAILLAQLQILRRMKKTRRWKVQHSTAMMVRRDSNVPSRDLREAS
jgi:hypothetical protein